MTNLIAKMTALQTLMFDVAFAMDYAAGLDQELQQHAAELAGGAEILQTWIDGIDGKAKTAENILADRKTVCYWAADDDGTWHTTCRNAFQFENSGPTENGFTHCPYCGKPLEIIT